MSTGAVTRLVLLRHAKSAWPDVADHERPLGPRGLRDAPEAGRWLRDAGCLPGLVICSTARRTRETWALAAGQLGIEVPVRFDERVYAAEPEDLLEVVSEVPAEVRTLLLVGHNPGLEDLAVNLAQEPGDAVDAEVMGRLSEKFPTSAIAVLACPGSWQELTPGSARLTAFAVPRGAAPRLRNSPEGH
ncbi:SixA phosphatase family protein [Streptomyces sp. NBC_01264]|uniref:SixA phosphatase family protein n=1 Tax=Streptomyces sp. NBC_01264 TaxID=2903804 RepID=UPI00224D33E9|nr:histidine phosphatase family protein [Streptomyces sp. NBC_01264]MCX4776059.1 histidine phosphatase family protein [Streptomyces sp. NBC_01264]